MLYSQLQVGQPHQGRRELFSIAAVEGAAPKAVNTALDSFGSVTDFEVSEDSRRVVYVANPNNADQASQRWLASAY